MIKLLTNILLLVIAIVLFCILAPIGILYTIFYIIKKFNLNYGIKHLSKIIRCIAVSIDLMGNVVCGDLFNDTLIYKNGHKFGNEDESISSVLGWNELKRKLKKLGRRLRNLLNFIDKNHCIKSIEKPGN